MERGTDMSYYMWWYKSNICVQFPSTYDIIRYLFCFYLYVSLSLYSFYNAEKKLFDKSFITSKISLCHLSVIKLERMNVSVFNSKHVIQTRNILSSDFYSMLFCWCSQIKKENQKAKLFTYRIRVHILSSKSSKQFSAIDSIFHIAFYIIWMNIIFMLSFMTSSAKHKMRHSFVWTHMCQSIHWHLQTWTYFAFSHIPFISSHILLVSYAPFRSFLFYSNQFFRLHRNDICIFPIWLFICLILSACVVFVLF